MRVIVAKPRGFCAGVDRAIKIVEQALEIYGSPLYMRHAIVHNPFVVDALVAKGAIFVDEISEIPQGARVVFSAHGVSPQVREEARARDIDIIDATCPLVTKVHLEVKRYAKEKHTIILIGHKDHVEVVGTSGEAPDDVIVVSSPQDAQDVAVRDVSKVAYTTQTTLSIDDTKEILDILKNRFPNIVGPPKPDICYATQNRQDVVKQLAAVVDVVYIVGSILSSNSKRLVEVASSCNVPAYLIDSADDLVPDRFHEGLVVGLSSGASTPETLVQAVINRLRSFGGASVEELGDVEETMYFELPRDLKELSQKRTRVSSETKEPE